MTEIKQFEFLKDMLYDISTYTNIYYDEYNIVREHVYETMKSIFDDLNDDLFNYNFDKLLIPKFIFNDNGECKVIKNRDNLIIPDEYKQLVEHVKYIANIPQPEQRTQEWFDMRRNMITASCAAQAIGENPYPNQKPDNLIMDKLGLSPPFQDNKFVHHGKKYEPIATFIYENIYNVKVDEYGLVPHISKPVVPFVGASPDGIASPYTLTNDFSPLIGRMLEIKCPLTRKIKTKGEIDGEICPHYYYCQVQQQLECCDLEYCDFWQCNLKEFFTKEELLNDKTELNYKEEQDKELKVPENCRMGCIIQFLPKSKINGFCIFDAKYIYPDNINLSNFEYDKWLLNEITNLHNKYPDLMSDYVFDRVLYWKLVECHNVVIKRDKEWFKKNYPKYKDIWDRVTLYRSDKKELDNFVSGMNVSKKKKIDKNQILFVDSDSDTD